MGLFPPFIGAEAGVFMHQRNGDKWKSKKALELPFAHRCEIINKNGVNYLFAASVSKYKANPEDWSKPGEMHLVKLSDKAELPLKSEIIDKSLTRNHGMLRSDILGEELLFISGAEGIFYFEMEQDNWAKKQFFDKEVSEFGFVDLDNDGQKELVTIEPFHGETLNVYKKNDGKWELQFSDTLSFGHGLSCGIFNGEPIIVVGSRRGSYALDLFKIKDKENWKFSRKCIEEDAGPTQTQVFSANRKDYILSANQKKNEVVLYY